VGTLQWAASHTVQYTWAQGFQHMACWHSLHQTCSSSTAPECSRIHWLTGRMAEVWGNFCHRVACQFSVAGDSLLIVVACEEKENMGPAPVARPACWAADSLPWCQSLLMMPSLWRNGMQQRHALTATWLLLWLELSPGQFPGSRCSYRQLTSACWKRFCFQHTSAISALDVLRWSAPQIYILLTYLLTYLAALLVSRVHQYQCQSFQMIVEWRSGSYCHLMSKLINNRSCTPSS